MQFFYIFFVNVSVAHFAAHAKKKVQDILARDQDVPLPRNEYTDPSYTECCEKHQYGLYTDLAKQAKAAAEGKGDDLGKFRQW